jgi:transglutaminase-like putative cysteine protease
MQRTVSCRLDAIVSEAADLVMSVAVSSCAAVSAESFAVTWNGSEIDVVEIAGDHGVRLHVAHAVPPGLIRIAYDAQVDGQARHLAVSELERIIYTRPSRYCESDRLAPFAKAELRGLRGRELLDAASSWVGQRVAYVPGASRSTDGAVATLLARQGVCRDFAHLVVALLRSCDVPARVVSVYAPGLQPMDFHAVAEACIDDEWMVVDATCLAPRSSMLRIATGRDAADTAFLTTTGAVELTSVTVTAVADALPEDDVTAVARLA